MKLSGPEFSFMGRFLIIDLVSSIDMGGTVQLPISPIVASLKVLFLFSLADFRINFLVFYLLYIHVF